MAMAQPPGGGRRFNEDTLNAAMMFAGVLLVVFFLLVARLYWDKKEGKDVRLEPTRSPAKVIREILK